MTGVFSRYFIEVEKVGRSCIQVTQYSRIVIDDIALLKKKKHEKYHRRRVDLHKIFSKP